MKKKWKQAVSLFTAAAVGLTSLPVMTAAAEEETGAMGRYIEEDVTLPAEVYRMLDLKVQTDGAVKLLIETGEGLSVLRSEDNGATWTQETVKTPDEGYAFAAALSPEGDVFATYSNEDSTVFTGYCSTIDGTLTEVVPKVDGENTELGDRFFTKLIYVEPGKVLGELLGSSKLYLFDDKTGEILQTYNENENYLAVWGVAAGKVYAFEQEELTVYDLETGEESSDEVLQEAVYANPKNLEIYTTSSYPVIFAENTEKDSLYYASADGLFRHVKDGTVVEQLADGALNSLGNPGYGLVNMQELPDGSFLIAGVDTSAGMGKLIRLVYSPDTPTVPSKELRVYSLREHDSLRQAIALFQKQNPEYYVHMEIGVSGEDAVTEADALRTLNTDIMAGKGPDILVLDGMPINSYIEKGVLADISPLLEGTASEDGFFENVQNAYEKDGVLYAVPEFFTLPVIWADEEALQQTDSLTALADIVQQKKETAEAGQRSIGVQDVYWFLKKMYDAYAVNFLQEDGRLNEEAVREFVTQTKRMFDIEMEGSDAEWQWDYQGNRNLSFTLGSISVAMMSMLAGELQIDVGTLENVMDMMQVVSVNEKKELMLDSLKLSENTVFVPKGILGINSKSTQQEDAGKLVSYLFSKEAQKLAVEGLPVNRAALTEIFDSYEDDTMIYGYSAASEDGEGLEIEVRKLSEEEEIQLLSLAEAADTAVPTDSVMEAMVIEQTGNCIAGQISEEEAVQSIIQKMNLYLSE